MAAFRTLSQPEISLNHISTSGNRKAATLQSPRFGTAQATAKSVCVGNAGGSNITAATRRKSQLQSIVIDAGNALSAEQLQNESVAVCSAVATGNLNKVKKMLEKDPQKAEVKCSSIKGKSLLSLAIHHVRGEMASFLYPKIIKGLETREIVEIYFNCINSSDKALYALALEILLDYPEELAKARHETTGETAFHVLAGKPLAFAPYWGALPWITGLAMQLKTPGLELLKQLILMNDDMTVDKFLPLLQLVQSDGKPSNALFIAAARGNDKFLGELFASYPALMKEKDENDRTVFHVAALHLQRTVFSLVGKSPYDEDAILSSEDNEGNTILHSAAEGVAPARYDKMEGPESRLKEHKKFFEMVRKILPPRCIDKKSLKDQTAEEIFVQKTKAVNDLLEKSWAFWLPIVASCFGILGTLILIFKFLWDKFSG